MKSFGGFEKGSPSLPEEIKGVLTRVRIGYACMSKQRFRNCLKRSIGAEKEDADRRYNIFYDNPLSYVCRTSNMDHSLELIRVMWNLGREKK